MHTAHICKLKPYGFLHKSVKSGTSELKKNKHKVLLGTATPLHVIYCTGFTDIVKALWDNNFRHGNSQGWTKIKKNVSEHFHSRTHVNRNAKNIKTRKAIACKLALILNTNCKLCKLKAWGLRHGKRRHRPIENEKVFERLMLQDTYKHREWK